MHFMYEVTCTDTLTYKQTNVKFMCGGVTCFVITVSINTLRRSAQRPTADARTHTHALPKSHRHTHPHVLTKNCKTDCEKCRMRWVGTIADAKSILDFVYSMFVCVCVCVFCVFRLHTNHTCRRAQLSRSKHRNRLSLLARSIVSVGTAVLVLER